MLEPAIEVPARRPLVRAYRFVRRHSTAVHAACHLMIVLPVAGTFAFGTTDLPKPILLAVCLGVAALTDLLWKRIPNAVLMATSVWIAVLHAGGRLGPWDDALLGAGACFAAMLAIHWCFGGGEGDVKLFAPVGALLGAWHGLEAIAFGYLLAGPVAVVLLLGRWAGCRHGPFRHATLPMAPFFAGGTWLTLALRGGP